MTDESRQPTPPPASSGPVPGRHAAPAPAESAATHGDDRDFARPPGSTGGFAERAVPPRYAPPPATVSPEERASYGRPFDGASFAPLPGERLAPRPPVRPAVTPLAEQTFAASPEAREGFAAAPGDRLPPRGAEPESPWWKADAPRDPWRDPASGFWLGRGAVFTRGRPTQLDPDTDSEAEDELEFLGKDDGTASDEGNGGGTVLRFGRRVVLFGVLVVLVVAAIGGGIGWFATKQTDEALHRPDVKIAQVETPTTRPAGSVAGVAKRVGPAVVSILVRTPDEFAVGSGVVIDRDGDILTNNHVIAAAAADSSGSSIATGSSIVVTFSDEATAEAKIVGRDPVSDLAVLKVPNDRLTVATLGDSNTLAVGDPVIAIGSPLGLQGTVTSGIVSALNRPVHVSNDDGSSDAYLDAIQTDAPINPGNSGGALVNGSGAVVGINSAGANGTTGGTAITGIGYAIPINYARSIALQLIHTGKASHASLGATGSTAVAGLQVGAYLKQVSPGGPAAKAGLKPGDVVVAANGTLVQTFDQLIVIVQQLRPGAKMVVEYYRNNSSTKSRTTVTLT